MPSRKRRRPSPNTIGKMSSSEFSPGVDPFQGLGHDELAHVVHLGREIIATRRPDAREPFPRPAAEQHGAGVHQFAQFEFVAGDRLRTQSKGPAAVRSAFCPVRILCEAVQRDELNNDDAVHVFLFSASPRASAFTSMTAGAWPVSTTARDPVEG